MNTKVTNDIASADLRSSVRMSDIPGIHAALAAGGDPNAQHRLDGDTPLHLACQRHSPEMARILLNAGADPVIRNIHGRDVVQWAFGCGAADVVKVLEDVGACQPMDQRQLNDALVHATQHRHAKMVQLLLSRGADPTTRANGRTLLQLAGRDGDEVKQLIFAARAGIRIEEGVAAALGEGDGLGRVARSNTPAL